LAPKNVSKTADFRRQGRAPPGVAAGEAMTPGDRWRQNEGHVETDPRLDGGGLVPRRRLRRQGGDAPSISWRADGRGIARTRSRHHASGHRRRTGTCDCIIGRSRGIARVARVTRAR
jgi:hypothetical protein